jgi:osmotically-inducible protein OsmY
MFRIMGRLFWMAVGATVAYFADPIGGRTRRTRVIDQLTSAAGDALDSVGRRTRHEMGRARGAVNGMMSTDEPRSDEELLMKVRSEAVGMVPASLDHIDVRVDDGIVYLLGESRDATSEHDLVDRLRRMTGVRDIRNELAPA